MDDDNNDKPIIIVDEDRFTKAWNEWQRSGGESQIMMMPAGSRMEIVTVGQGAEIGQIMGAGLMTEEEARAAIDEVMP